MTNGKVISENIKRLRAKLGLTQDDLAKKADIKYTTLMKVESGAVNRPSVQTMAKIAKALGVSMEELIKQNYANTLESKSRKRFLFKIFGVRNAGTTFLYHQK